MVSELKIDVPSKVGDCILMRELMIVTDALRNRGFNVTDEVAEKFIKTGEGLELWDGACDFVYRAYSEDFSSYIRTVMEHRAYNILKTNGKRVDC